MKSHLIRIVFALVCFGSASAFVARAAEHGLAFKDVSLGITLADFCAKYDRPFEGDPRRAPSLIFGDIFANTKPDPGRRPKRDYRSLGMVSAQKNAPFEVSKGSVPPDTIAGITADVYFHFFVESLPDWDSLAKWHQEGRKAAVSSVGSKAAPWREAPAEIVAAASRFSLGEIRVNFAQGDFDAVVAALREKYGAPPEERIETLQNAMGANYSSRHIGWSIGQDRIEAEERSGGVDQSVVRFWRKGVMSRSHVHIQERIEKAAKDL